MLDFKLRTAAKYFENIFGKTIKNIRNHKQRKWQDQKLCQALKMGIHFGKSCFLKKWENQDEGGIGNTGFEYMVWWNIGMMENELGGKIMIGMLHWRLIYMHIKMVKKSWKISTAKVQRSVWSLKALLLMIIRPVCLMIEQMQRANVFREKKIRSVHCK